MPEMTNEEIVQDRQEGFGNPEEKTAEVATPKEEVKEVVESADDQAEELSDSDEATEEADAEESDDDSGDTSEDDSSDDSDEEVDEVEETQTKKEKVPGYQKRIDKLTAEKYRLEAELKLIKEQSVKKEEPKQEKRYTEQQLETAKRKAIEENDLQLLAEVFKEEQRNLKLDLINQYENEKKQAVNLNTEKQRQWNTIVDRYADDSDPTMDIRNVNSELYKVAKSYFEDPQLSKEYSGSKGMLLAVADAFAELSKVRRKKKLNKSPKEKNLERKLIKEKRKNSLGKPNHDKQVAPVTQKHSDSVMDYIKERQSVINKALGN